MNLISYSDISKLFLSPLSDPAFQNFLSTHFDDLSEYNVSKSDYMVSKSTLVEFGFTNPDAVYDDDEQEVFGKGNPFFSHFNLFPQSRVKVYELPYGIKFSDKREEVHLKTGEPLRTSKFDKTPLHPGGVLIDHYKLGNLAISIDYHPQSLSIKFIQLRDHETKPIVF